MPIILIMLLWALACGGLAQETPDKDPGAGSADVFSTSDEDQQEEEPDCE